jgi:hypothetical protein
MKGCSEYKPKDATWEMPCAFASSKAWIEHMRTVHDKCEFSFPQPGCDRINAKGYFRKYDLRAHLRKVHGTDGSLEDDDMN